MLSSRVTDAGLSRINNKQKMTWGVSIGRRARCSILGILNLTPREMESLRAIETILKR
jgi:hypothetical protein